MEGNSRGDILRTIGWFLVSIAGLGVIGRSGVKAGVIRRFGADDVFIGLAFIFFVGQVVCVHLEIKHGLGQQENTATPEDIDMLLKLDWAQDLLFMPVYGFAKLSVVSLLRRFTLGKRDRFLLYCFEWILALWSIASEAVWAFECSLPTPWNYVKGTCINRTIWIVIFEGVNIVTDLMLIIMPAMVILSLKAPLKRRLTSASFFIARFCILPASAARIYYWITDTHTTGITYDIFTYMIATMTVCALEILAGCILYLQPLFETLESGFMWGGDLRRRGQTFVQTVNFGARGTLPFTKMRNPLAEDMLTGQHTAYSVRAEGPDHSIPHDEEKEIEISKPSPQGIQMNQTIHVHSSPDPGERTSLPDTAEAGTITVIGSTSRPPPKNNDESSNEKHASGASASSKDEKRDSNRSSRSIGEVFLPFMGTKRNSNGKRTSGEDSGNSKKRKSIPRLDVAIPRSSLHVTTSQRTNISAIMAEDSKKRLPDIPSVSESVPAQPQPGNQTWPALNEERSRKPSLGW